LRTFFDSPSIECSIAPGLTTPARTAPNTASDHLQPTMSSTMRATGVPPAAVLSMADCGAAGMGTVWCLLFKRAARCCNDIRSDPGGASMRTAVLLALFATAVSAADAPRVPYPEGYRQWTHVKSMVIQPGHALYEAFGGIHHLYGNAKAMQGYQRGGQFPDGAVIVFDLLDAKSADQSVQEGARKVVGVMHKDARKYAATGGWGYEGFKGDSKTERAVAGNAAAACHGCHQAQKDKDFVFSTLRP
jgi:hypothetical protein